MTCLATATCLADPLPGPNARAPGVVPNRSPSRTNSTKTSTRSGVFSSFHPCRLRARLFLLSRPIPHQAPPAAHQHVSVPSSLVSPPSSIPSWLVFCPSSPFFSAQARRALQPSSPGSKSPTYANSVPTTASSKAGHCSVCSTVRSWVVQVAPRVRTRSRLWFAPSRHPRSALRTSSPPASTRPRLRTEYPLHRQPQPQVRPSPDRLCT